MMNKSLTTKISSMCSSTLGRNHRNSLPLVYFSTQMSQDEEFRKLDLFNPTEEHLSLRKLVREFVEKEVEPQALQYNREEKLNIGLFRKLAELGMFGITVPEKYGGSGMDAVAAVIVSEELSASDPGICLSNGAQSMLFINNLNQNGNESQKEKFLPKACAGEIICGLCMSESSAGTDVLAMNTFAQPTGESFILNGSKMWITNGTIDGTDTGDAFLAYAKTDRNAKFGGLTMFLVEKGMKGFRLGHQVKDKLGIRSSPTAELIFEDVKIPRENVVGKVGEATLCMMRNLELERLGLAGMSLGIARRCIEIMSAYSQERKAFGKPIQEFGQIQKAIAESYAEYLAGRSFVYDLARRIDLSKYGQGLDSDAVKLFCAPMAKRVADRAIQVLGGNGYVGEYVVERLWRDAKLMEIGGGTIEAHHKNLYRDMKALNGRIL